MTHHLYLVPGFFGFSSVGAVSYFEDVERVLGAALRRRGVDARIVGCRTQPTASIRRRAEALRLQVQRNGGLKAEALHFVGHSTGGGQATRYAVRHGNRRVAKLVVMVKTAK